MDALLAGGTTPLHRAYRLGAETRAMTIAAWLRTLVDWNVSLDRAADWIETGVPWSDSELGGWDGVNPGSSAPVVEDDHEGR
jgi:hypothetical protein